MVAQQRLTQTTGISKPHCIKYPSNHFNPLESHSWGQVGCQMKRKSSRNSFFLVSAATFQSELNNLQKRPKYVKKCNFCDGFSKFIQLWLKSSSSNPKIQVPFSFFASFDTLLDPRGATLVEIRITSKIAFLKWFEMYLIQCALLF